MPRHRPRAQKRRLLPGVACLIAAIAVAGCGRSGPPPVGASASGPRFVVLAAENFWGNLAAQLAGSKASVSSIIVNPAADPHSYQPSTVDGRRIAGANMVIVNGLGYDEWAEQLLRASPSSARVVLNVGDRLGLPAGSNPHRWYFPGDVRAVIAAIVAGYDRLDPADASYFAAQRTQLETHGPRALRRAAARDTSALRGRARRLQREHLPGAGG